MSFQIFAPVRPLPKYASILPDAASMAAFSRVAISKARGMRAAGSFVSSSMLHSTQARFGGRAFPGRLGSMGMPGSRGSLDG